MPEEDLAAFESISRNPWIAAQKQASLWWCTAYHERFGRCGPRCPFERLVGAEGSLVWRQCVASCVAAAALGLTAIERLTWKVRYQEMEALNRDAWKMDSPKCPTSPGSPVYSISGKKVTAGNEALDLQSFRQLLACAPRPIQEQ